jgi:tRNA nucleotidyltransferase (CCA-adding enzyme)
MKPNRTQNGKRIMSNIKIYKVGGAVRDQFLNRPNKDVDFAVEAESYDAMKEYILANGGKIYLETPEFLTIRGKMPNLGDADFVLCRKDGQYSDGRRPDTVVPGTIMDDLSRREITINAMAVDVETGDVLDPFNGRADIENKLLRAVGDAEKRFNEDPLRLLRAMRFSVTLEFALHEDLIKLLSDPKMSKRMMATVSQDRIREELDKMFKADTLLTLKTLEQFPSVRDAVFGGNLWLNVTNEKRKKK